MKIIFRVLVALVFINFFFMCNRTGKNEDAETILTGTASVMVDETLLPIIQDEKTVFENTYKAKINLLPRSEGEAIRGLLKDSSQIIVLARNLNSEELSFFKSAKRYPKVTPFAKDAIALIGNLSRNDSTIALSEVINFMKGETSSSFKGLVFDNPNSGTVQFFNHLANLKDMPDKGVYSFKNNSEVFKFVAENPDMIGVVGINWILQPTPEIQSYLKKIKVLDVQGIDKQGFYAPSQNNLAQGLYPLARQLYFVNVQGYDGLGMGFASFIAGERGQRIILQSGLLPERIPSRKIITRKSL